MPEPIVQVRGLTKTYESGAAAARALDGVNLDVHAGEVMLLMGPSGSVRIKGREITGLKEKQLPRIRLDNIGFVFQGFNLFPTLTSSENVEIGLDLKGVRVRQRKQRARALLDSVGLSDKYDAFPADLSGGQKQRVAIARALAGDPGIILADEPTAALDSVTGRTVMDMMRKLAKDRGRAVVVVSHDGRVMEYADRVVHIEDGKILNGGTH